VRLEPEAQQKAARRQFFGRGHRPVRVWPLIIESLKLGNYVFVYKNNPYKGAIFIPKNPTKSRAYTAVKLLI